MSALLAARSAWRAPARKHQRTRSSLMSRFVLPSTSVVRLATAAVVLALACQTANVQVKPFKVRGGGPAPEGLSPFGADSPHSATGQATHLGRYSGNGVANVLSFNPSTGGGTFHGSYTFVAANGDRLAFTYGDTDNGAEQVGEFQTVRRRRGQSLCGVRRRVQPDPGAVHRTLQGCHRRELHHGGHDRAVRAWNSMRTGLPRRSITRGRGKGGLSSAGVRPNQPLQRTGPA